MSEVETPFVQQTRRPRAIRRSLAAKSAAGGDDFWSFRTAVRARDADEVLFQYPAMMVSPMQGALIDVLREHREGAMIVFDPFVGSGTTLIEAIRRGLPFVGTDLNPLAVMLSRVESAEAAIYDMPASLARLKELLVDARGVVERVEDEWTVRWFRSDVSRELAALKATIRTEREPALRRLWWACLAEVARLTSNARLSTPKLQTRRLEELARPIDVAGRFEHLAERAIRVIARRGQTLTDAGYMKAGRYGPGAIVQLADARKLPASLHGSADVILTSPPYGDNHTTMPYGQASFLPLLWIDLADAAGEIPPELLASSRSLDTLSLGGSRRTAESEAVAPLADQSPALARLLNDLKRSRREAWQRVASFFVDYAEACDSILAAAKPDAHLILTLGDRTVRGRHVPTALITQQLLEARGVCLLDTLHRAIPHHRRIAMRNELAETMGSETVLVLQRSGR